MKRNLQALAASFVPHVAALCAYTLLGLLMTWPLLRYWNTGFLGFARSFEDGAQNVWNMWWMRWAVEHGQSPFWNPLLYYPDGLQMYLQAISAPGAFLALPITYFAGPVAAYNSATLTAFVLTGYGSLLFVRAFVPDWRIAWLCGALVVASPFFTVRLQTNQLNLTSMQWLPFYFLALLQLERKRTWWPLLWAVLLVVLLVLTDWYWTMACIVYTAVWALTGLWRARDRGWYLRRYLVFGAATLLALAPYFYAIAQTRAQLPVGTGEDNPNWDLYIRGFSADALGLFYPAAFQPLWAGLSERFLAAVAPGPFTFEGWYVAAGWVLLALAGLGLWRGGRAHWRLLAAGGAGWLFALGPTLRVLGRDTGIAMPYALVQALPLLSTARRPNLFAVPCIIIAAVFAGIALHWMMANGGRPKGGAPFGDERAERRRRADRETSRGAKPGARFAPFAVGMLDQKPQRRNAVLLGVAALAALELWPPTRHDLEIFTPSALAAAIGARPGVVADLPYERQESSRALRNQVAHEQPILGGYVSRRPRYDSLRFLPHLGQISAMRPWPSADIVPVTPEVLAAAQCAYPLRHVLVRKNEVTPAQMQGLTAVLTQLSDGPLVPAGEDARDLWYELPQHADACRPFLYLGRGWYDVEYAATRQWRWASDTSDVWAVNPFDAPIGVMIELTAEAFGPPGSSRALEVWQGERRVAAWSVGREQRSYRVFVSLPPGRHLLQLRAETTRDPATGRTLSISVTSLKLQESGVRSRESGGDG